MNESADNSQLFFSHYLNKDCVDAYHHLGGRLHNQGARFTVYAPYAKQVFVKGEFNQWNQTSHPLTKNSLGFWSIDVSSLKESDTYLFVIAKQDGGFIDKADPYALYSALRPNRYNMLFDIENYQWQDNKWMRNRKQKNHLKEPMNIYEVHLGSWIRNSSSFHNYREIAKQLVPYLKKHHFTHVELLPLAGHPLDESWGYQVSAYFSITSRFGTPRDFQWFVDYMHQHEIGVIIDWVGGHFPTDVFALAQFDGSYLYEHEDPLKGTQPKWNTLVFDYGKQHVKNFLLSNLFFWVEQTHIDGIRFDAVTAMVHLDFERKHHEWKPNHLGGKEHLEAVHFLQNANDLIHEKYPEIYTIAEEAYTFPKVTFPTNQGGLGFDYKWALGWTYDTLDFFQTPYEHRCHKFDKLCFYLDYCHEEQYQLTLSHDEVVKGQGSLFSRMPGDRQEKMLNILALLTIYIGFVGKKLLFMGGEYGEDKEWNSLSELSWGILKDPLHTTLNKKVRNLFSLYQKSSALWKDEDRATFTWIHGDKNQPFLCFMRKDKKQRFLFCINLSNQPYLYECNFPQMKEIQLLFSSYKKTQKHVVGKLPYQLQCRPLEVLIFKGHISDE